jgi:molybdopterin molybdotransferase
VPGPGQIRNSNEIMLAAQTCRAGATPLTLGIAPDEPERLQQLMLRGIECDILLVSGGVSAGKLDLVPAALEAAGVRCVFHKVRVRPGKPIWFGVRDPSESSMTENGTGTERPVRSQSQIHGRHRTFCSEPVPGSWQVSNVVFGASPSFVPTRCHVFGLPGNPVSSMVCFELFVRTAIRRLMGIEPAEPQPIRARLKVGFSAAWDRPMYHPAVLEWSGSGPTVQRVAWKGSFDLRATVEANVMAVFPEGDHTYRAGDMVDVIAWD